MCVVSHSPFLNDELGGRLVCGAVQLREDVKRFTSNGVEFKDGTYQDIDIVVLATGYIIGFPFVDKEVMMGTMMMMIIIRLVMLLFSWEQRAMKRIEPSAS